MDVALSQQNYQKLLTAERQLTDIVADLDKAEQCGIDCQTYRQTLKNQLTAIANMKLHFAPKQQ